MLLAGGIGASALVSAGAAEAATCATGSNCTITGTLTLGAGGLSLTAPGSLAWGGTVTGLDQQLVDVVTADHTYLVTNATGGTAGWHVTVSATTFTTGSLTLADLATFATNGSTTSMAAATVPTAACLSGSTCTLPTNTTTYPVAITTAATTPTPVTIYNAALSTGIGSVTIGLGANPVGWWLNLPSNTPAGVYTSTINLTVTTAP